MGVGVAVGAGVLVAVAVGLGVTVYTAVGVAGAALATVTAVPVALTGVAGWLVKWIVGAAAVGALTSWAALVGWQAARAASHSRERIVSQIGPAGCPDLPA